MSGFKHRNVVLFSTLTSILFRCVFQIYQPSFYWIYFSSPIANQWHNAVSTSLKHIWIFWLKFLRLYIQFLLEEIQKSHLVAIWWWPQVFWVLSEILGTDWLAGDMASLNYQFSRIHPCLAHWKQYQINISISVSLMRDMAFSEKREVCLWPPQTNPSQSGLSITDLNTGIRLNSARHPSLFESGSIINIYCILVKRPK